MRSSSVNFLRAFWSTPQVAKRRSATERGTSADATVSIREPADSNYYGNERLASDADSIRSKGSLNAGQVAIA
jgi:hypothetical protein